MKKYLTLATILGAIAFVSVSYLAQAEEKSAAPAAAAAVTAPAAPAAAGSFAADKDVCTTMAAAPAAEGKAPSDEAKATAFKKCMMDKGHKEDELKKTEADAKAAAPVEKK